MCRRKGRRQLQAASIAAAALAVTVAAGCASGGGPNEKAMPVQVEAKSEGQTAQTQTPLLQSTDMRDDFWQTSTPAAAGMDEALLNLIQAEAESNHKRLYSLLVVRHGRIVVDQYYQGRTAADLASVFSVSKSMLSALAGIAIQDGIFQGIGQDIGTLLPEEARRKLQEPLQLKHLLTMSGGLQSVDDNFMSFYNSGNWVDYVLEQPAEGRPGAAFRYNTGLSHLLSAVLTQASGQSTKDYAVEHLLGPLGITAFKWDQDPQGIYTGGMGVSLRPRDMAKFGYLYLQGGLWKGRQIVPKEWVEASTAEQIKTDDKGGRYGYNFWLDTVRTKDGVQHAAYAATGFGDQLILVVPHLDLVVVATSAIDSRVAASAGDLIDKLVIPAIVD